MEFKNLKIISVISMVWSGLVLLCSVLGFALTALFGRDIQNTMSDGGFGAVLAFFWGGVLWIGLIVLSCILLLNGILSLIASIFGYKAAVNGRRGFAITNIVLNSIILLLCLPSGCFFAIFGILPILNIIFSAMMLKASKAQPEIVGIER